MTSKVTFVCPLLRCSWEIIDSGQDAVGHSGPQLSDSLRLFLQEMSAFKQQNPGKVRVVASWRLL